jgi:hypothetical protein
MLVGATVVMKEELFVRISKMVEVVFILVMELQEV